MISGCDLMESGEAKDVSVKIGEADFDSFISKEDKLVLVDFSADWCAPCKTLKPKLNKLASEHRDKVALGVVDTDESPQLAKRLGVGGIPDVRMFINGRESGKFIGDIPESRLRKLIEAQLKKLESTEKSPDKESDDKSSGGKIQPMSEDWMPPGIEKRS